MVLNKASESFRSVGAQRLVLVALALIVYGVSLANDFVWDDRIYTIGNPVYRDFNLRAIFFSLANDVEYLPLRDVTYALDYLLWGEKPLGFHLSNLTLFVATTVCSFELARLILQRLAALSGRYLHGYLPFVVAAGFALHPLNAEVVNFITCRNVLVSALFFFLSCICIIRFMEKPVFSISLYLAALLAFVCAMLGKATAIFLPLLLLATLPVMFHGCLKRTLLVLAPFLVAAAGFSLVFKRIADKAGFTDSATVELNLFSLGHKIAIAVQIPFFYLKKMLLPYGFSVDYEPAFASRLLSLKAILAMAALAAMVTCAVLLRRRLPGITVGVFWFLTALMPVLNFFGTTPVVADRYAFLSTFGFILCSVTLADRFVGSRFKGGVTVSILLLLAGISFARSLDWKSSETLWLANIRNFPDNAKSYTNLAAYYYGRGEHQRAVDLLLTHSTIPSLPMYYHFYRGRQLYDQKRLAEAKQQFLYIVDNIESGLVGALYYLGIIAESDGDLMTATYYYNKALNSRLRALSGYVPKVRGRMKHLRTTWLDGYLDSLRRGVLENEGDLRLRRELALTLDRLGLYNDALEQYRFLEGKGVTGWQLLHNIGNCYFSLNRFADAAPYYEKVIALGGVSEETYNNLGIIYRRFEQYDDSIRVLTEGVRLFPEASFPAYNLAVTYQSAGLKEKALSSFRELERKFPGLHDLAAPHIKELSASAD